MSIQQAQQKIYEITSQVIQSYTKRLKTIPTSFYPLISVKVAQIEQQFNVQISIPSQARLRAIAHQAIGEESETTENERVKLSSIIIKGEKQNIKLAISSLERNYSDCQRTTKTISIPIPKRQHRTLVGSIGDEILEISQCIVELPPADDISETCTIRGPQVKLPAALQLVMEKASALAVETVDLLNIHKVKVDINYGKSLLRFLLRGGKLRKIADNHPGAKIYPPRQGYIEKSNSVVIDIVSQDSKAAIDARNDVESLIKTIPPSAINYVEIDHLLHRHLIGKQSRLFEDQQSITLLFPNENDQSDQITLVYFGASQLGLDGKALDNKVKEIIENAKNQLLELGKAAANITLEIISVEPKFHKSIIGSGGSTLNAVIGEDKIVDVQLGTSKLNENNNSRNKKDLKENEISIRGPKEEVERVANEIRKIANEAENHHLIYGHETELIVNSQFVAHIVGKNGTSISKLRESLDVQIDINQRLQNDNKKGVQKAVIKITGRKENAEEAKRRLSSLVELLADQTTEKLNIAKQYHASLIGSGGKYAIRLEEKHGVRITFPKNDDQSDNSEVIIKGGKKGVSQAKSELLEALEFEKENNNTLNISIPSSAIARIVGKGGYQINEIKENSLAQIDFDRSSQGPKTTIILKGTKKAINNAKNEILKIIDQINSQITIIIDDIDVKYHKSIIGQGGQKLRELITKAGGKTDSSTSQLVQFPKQNSGDNNIVIKGEKSLAANMEKEIREFVKEISDRKTIGVSVPVILHGDLIGRGGFKMLEFQKKFNVTLYFPGSRDYKSTDKVVNENELTDVKEESIIKITGKTSNVQNAVEELKNKSNIHSKSIEIENKHYSVISDGGRFFRNLRSNGVMIDISNENENNLNLSKSKYTANIPQPTSLEIPTPTSRVDDDTEDEISYNWELKEIVNVEIEGKSIWTINGKDESSVNKTIEKINKLIEINSNTQFVGYLILQNRSTFPRIVGSKGSGIERVKNESGVQQLTVSKNDLPLITFIGEFSFTQKDYVFY